MTMTSTNTGETDVEQREAEEYLDSLAGHTNGMTGEYEFTGIEVPDSIAGKMRDDPRVTITEVSKGEFGMDQGTMILSFMLHN